MNKPVLVVSTGAGISAESGIKTFRDADGLLENYPVMQVASADGFRRDPVLIHRFYNERRRQLVGAESQRRPSRPCRAGERLRCLHHNPECRRSQ